MPGANVCSFPGIHWNIGWSHCGGTGNSTCCAKHCIWGRLGVLMVFLGIWKQVVRINGKMLSYIRQEPGSVGMRAIPRGDERFWFLLTWFVRPPPQKSTCPGGTEDWNKISSSCMTQHNTFYNESSDWQPAEHGEREMSFHREWFKGSHRGFTDSIQNLKPGV